MKCYSMESILMGELSISINHLNQNQSNLELLKANHSQSDTWDILLITRANGDRLDHTD